MNTNHVCPGKIRFVEFLDQIVASVSKDPVALIAVALAAFMGALAAAIFTGLWRFFFHIVPRFIWGRCRPYCSGFYGRARVKFRSWRAKHIMLAYLQERTIWIPPDTYADSRDVNLRTKDRSRLSAVAPTKPAWLNDGYISGALDELVRAGKLAKAEGYDQRGWPPRVVRYVFSRPKMNRSATDEAAELETEGKCRLYQGFRRCPMDERYEYEGYAKTVSAWKAQSGTRSRLRDSVPPCERCWEKHAREDAFRGLIRNMTTYDFAKEFTDDISGENEEFQEVVVAVCLLNDAQTDVPSFKRIIERAINIRRGQLDPKGLSGSTEWTEEQTAKFADALITCVQTEQEEKLTNHHR